MTDEATYYGKLGKEFKHHFTVEHGAGGICSRLRFPREHPGRLFLDL